MIRPGLGQDTIPDTGHGHGDNLGKLDSVISIPSAGTRAASIHRLAVFLNPGPGAFINIIDVLLFGSHTCIKILIS